MAVTNGKAVSQGTYVVAKRDTALANAGTIVIDHAKDSLGARDVKLINGTTGVEILKAATWTITHTSETRTTITNVTLGTVDVKAVVSVPANTGALA